MTQHRPPRVLSIPPGAPFLPTLATAFLEGRLVPGFAYDGDPLSLADATIFVPTRRAARVLRSVFAEKLGKRSAILPVIRPLGEVDEDSAAFEIGADALDLPPPIAATDRLLLLAPLVREWKKRLPAHIAALFEEEVIVPASAADAIWLARDLAALIDQVETEGGDWTRLSDLATGTLANWWQVTLDFLAIVTEAWPDVLRQLDRSNPAAYRNALIRAEADRLVRNAPRGPVIAAGSTGSIPATADLLAAIARLENGAVVLPGFDAALDERSRAALDVAAPVPQLLGHPQYGLTKLIRRIGVTRDDIVDLDGQASSLRLRASLVSEAMRPAETSDLWADSRGRLDEQAVTEALAGITLIEAGNEHEEALAIALALRRAAAEPGRRAALVTPDRELARRVSADLLRFGITADDSGGTSLLHTPPAQLLTLLVEAAVRPGAPVPIAALLKHPLLHLGLDRKAVRHASEAVELIALRGSPTRPDITDLARLFESRYERLRSNPRKPFWLNRIGQETLRVARLLVQRLQAASLPLAVLRADATTTLAEALRLTVTALEALGRAENGGLDPIYGGDAGRKLGEALAALAASTSPFDFPARDWPDVLSALLAPEVVKPSAGGDGRVAIWGTLEARLQSVDTLVVAGLNEGSWPRRAEADRFMSRLMKGGLELEPPERRIGQAAHDFAMAMGTADIVLTRAARSGEAPATASRWLQRFTTFIGKDQTASLRARGESLLAIARQLDRSMTARPFPRPRPTPPVAARPKEFSVTEIEMLRRDPYAIYARHILGLSPIDPLVRDPGAAERGTLFHAILHRFTMACPDPNAPDSERILIEAGREAFRELGLPSDIDAVWWPRFLSLATRPDGLIAWDRTRPGGVAARHPEMRAEKTPIGRTGVTLRGFADRIDVLAGGMADILDYKTGSSPSTAQAHTLIAPQLALEGALLVRGAFTTIGKREPSILAHIRLKASGEVFEESILEYKKQAKSARSLADDAWRRLEELITAYKEPSRGYISRSLPFREGETDGDYDHLARVLEWSAGGDDEEAVE